jgi:hypothetical protein
MLASMSQQPCFWKMLTWQHFSGMAGLSAIFYTEHNDKPGYVVNDHLSGIIVADNL